ncbi:MAG TPA: hypothetical protein VMT03_05250, partial [Polyangia bacterium]|nr:hypothetical protein [Polyangia bacterium]
MKRPPTSPKLDAPLLTRHQLSLPFGAETPAPREVSRSQRSLRQAAAGREVRLAISLEETTDRM